MSRRAHAELYYHYAWATKQRAPLIARSWEHRLYGYIANKCIQNGYLPLGVNGVEDHVHCLVRVRPHVAPCDIAGTLKGSSSHFVNDTVLCSQHFAWQEGYGVVSVSPRAVRKVIDYINNQKRHHAIGDTDELYETMEEEEDGPDSDWEIGVVGQGVNAGSEHRIAPR
jgi:putative transposase